MKNENENEHYDWKWKWKIRLNMKIKNWENKIWQMNNKNWKWRLSISGEEKKSKNNLKSIISRFNLQSMQNHAININSLCKNMKSNWITWQEYE